MHSIRTSRWFAVLSLIALPAMVALPQPIEGIGVDRPGRPPVCPHDGPVCPSPIEPQLLPSSQR